MSNQIIGLGRFNSAPTSAPTLQPSLATAALTGTYRYALTFADALGETVLGPSSANITVSSSAILLTNIPIGPANVTQRVIYRTKASGSVLYKLTTLPNNTATTYVDSTPDIFLVTLPNALNTSVTREVLEGQIVFARPFVSGYEEVSASLVNPPLITQDTTVVIGGAGMVYLPPVNLTTKGVRLTINNKTLATVDVHPQPGGNINGLVGIGLVANAAGFFICVGVDAWCCIPIGASGSGNPFDQSLNTTDSPSFEELSVIGITGSPGELSIRSPTDFTNHKIENISQVNIGTSALPTANTFYGRAPSYWSLTESVGGNRTTYTSNTQAQAFEQTVNGTGTTLAAFGTGSAGSLNIYTGGTITPTPFNPVLGLPPLPSVQITNTGNTSVRQLQVLNLPIDSSLTNNVMTVDGSGNVQKRTFGSISHTWLGDIGVNTHAMIDSKLATLFTSVAPSNNIETITSSITTTVATPVTLHTETMPDQTTDSVNTEIVVNDVTTGTGAAFTARKLLRNSGGFVREIGGGTSTTVTEPPLTGSISYAINLLPSGYNLTFSGTGFSTLNVTHYTKIIRA